MTEHFSAGMLDPDSLYAALSTTTNQDMTLYNPIPVQLRALEQGLQCESQGYPDLLEQSDILDGLEYSDILTSPSTQNTYFEPMESEQSPHPTTENPRDDCTDRVTDGYRNEAPMVGPGPGSGLGPNPGTGPMISASEATSVFTAGNPQSLYPAMHVDSGGDASKPAESGMFDDMEATFRLDSTEERRILRNDPYLGEERLNSVEMKSSGSEDRRQRSERQMDVGLDSTTRDSHGGSSSSSTPTATSSTQIKSRVSSGTSSTSAYMDTYKLPENHIFKVQVSFIKKVVLEERVTNPNGCLLCSMRHGQQEATQSATDGDLKTIVIPTVVRKPDGSVQENSWVNEKQKKYTEMLLQHFEKGLLLRCNGGNLYATRRAATKLFWLSTEESAGEAKELKRDEETEIFNLAKFRKGLATAYATGRQRECDLPAVWISFAQKWDRTSCPLNTKLVWARIEPTMARDMVKGVNPNVRQSSYLESLDSGKFLFSHE